MAKPLKNLEKGNGRGNQTDDTTDIQSGTSGDDLLIGTDSTDVLIGLGGDDTLVAGNGNDMLDGGSGSDSYVVSGYGGVDTYEDSGAGVGEVVVAADGTETTSEDWDVILADYHGTAIYMSNFGPENGIEEISGNGWGNVSIRGTASDNTLDFSETLLTDIYYIDGSGGNDEIIGSTGDDTILGGGGDDSISGGGGNDLLYGGGGNDLFIANIEGTDTIADFDGEYDALDLSGIELEEGQKISVTETATNTEFSLDGLPFLIVEETEIDNLNLDPDDPELDFFIL